MLVFSTCLPLKSEVSQENWFSIVSKWLIGSPHYNIKHINYDIYSGEDFECISGNIRFYIRCYRDQQKEIFACRLENQCEDALWINDCIFLNENGSKSLLVQLNCNHLNYRAKLPYTNKPRIVKMFVESGYCKDDAGIPVTDTPINSDGKYLDTCIKIMQGKCSSKMPSIYISCDYWGGTTVSPSFLAKRLSGVAHVFVEKEYNTALKLRDATNGNNVHTGYVGAYFPGNACCQKFGLSYYKDFKEMCSEIINSVNRALVNRIDSSIYNWNQIIILQSRQKMSEWQDISSKDKRQLKEYMDYFDAENETLRQQIDERNSEVYSLRTQLDNLRATISSNNKDGCFYKIGSEPNLYASERNDLLYSILSQVKNKFDKKSRAYNIIEALLEANPRNGECSKIVSEVKAIFNRGGKLSNADKSKLKSIGFEIEEDGPHYKLIFHDRRYMFTIAKTPGDHRDGKNLASEICKLIDVEKKLNVY